MTQVMFYVGMGAAGGERLQGAAGRTVMQVANVVRHKETELITGMKHEGKNSGPRLHRLPRPGHDLWKGGCRTGVDVLWR